jgi:hypothetical protein
MVRPLMVLLFVNLLFFEIYEVFIVAYMPNTLPLDLAPVIRKSLAFSFQQTVAPFVVWTTDSSDLGMACGDCLGLKVVASIHSVLSISIITAWLLAIRWHVKWG